MLCLFSYFSLGQNTDPKASSTEDSIKLYLVTPAVTIHTDVLPFRWDSIGCIVPPISYPPPFDWRTIGPISPTICIWAPTCGDTYHANGKLSSRIACEKGIQHGKTQYFDEDGRKTSESYFIHGTLISSKSFDGKGRLVSWANYDGKGELHGYNYSWDEYNGTKIITRYVHGIEHGLREEYSNGVLNVEQVYDKGEVTKQTYYFENKQVYQRSTFHKGQILCEEIFREDGSISSYAMNDTLGHRVLDYTKNERGIITSERHYQNNHIVGTTLESYDDQTGYRMTVEYENGQPLASYERHGEHIYRIKHFTQGRFDSLITFHENGDTSELLTTGNIWRQQKWDISGKQTDDYTFYNDGFSGNGYYMINDTTFIVNVHESPQAYNSTPIARWVIFNDDTLRMDYIHNNKNIVDRIFPYYLHRNYFKLDSISNRYVRDGQWCIYEGNVISEVVTYSKGVKHGGYILYDASTPPAPMVTGNYSNGKKDGLWVSNGGRMELITYENGVLDGLYRIIDSQNVVRESGTFRDGLIVGDFTTYYENAKKQSVVTYAPGQNIGYEKIYDHNGRLFSEGPVKRVIDVNPEIRNQHVGKWTFYTYNAKGKAKKSTVNYGGFKASRSQNPSGGSLPDSLQSHFQPLEPSHQILLL